MGSEPKPFQHVLTRVCPKMVYRTPKTGGVPINNGYYWMVSRNPHLWTNPSDEFMVVEVIRGLFLDNAHYSLFQ